MMKRSILIAVATLLGVPSVWADFADDFNRSDTTFSSDGSLIGSSWVNSRYGLWRIQNNQLEADIVTANTALYYTGQQMRSGDGVSFEVRADVKPLQTNAWAGLVFHYRNNEQFYWLRIKSGTATALMDIYDNGNTTRLKTITCTESFLADTAYTVSVRSICPYNFVYEIKEAVSGDILASGYVEDPYDTYMKGYAGVLQGTPGYGLYIFDNFELNEMLGPYAYIDAEPDPDDLDIWGFSPKENPPSYWPGDFVDNAQMFRVYEQGLWHVRPWVSSSLVVNASNTSSSCIGFHGIAAPDNYNVKDKGEIVISQKDDSSALTLNGLRYLAFDFYIDPVSLTPLNWTLICQALQDAEAGHSPPFAIYVREDSSPAYPDENHVFLDFVLSNDNVSQTNVWSTTVEKGTWHHIIVQLKPSPLNDGEDGQLAIYYDSDPGDGADYVWQGDWGYAPHAAEPYVGNTFDVRMGIYRRKQPRAFSWFMDNIRFGSQKSTVEW